MRKLKGYCGKREVMRKKRYSDTGEIKKERNSV
jgi:hypothetical protein